MSLEFQTENKFLFSSKLITLGGLNWRLSLPGGGLNIWLRSASSGGGALPPKDPDGGIIGGGARTGGGAILGGSTAGGCCTTGGCCATGGGCTTGGGCVTVAD